MKANVDARARAKVEKELEKNRIAEEERVDNERRETDLDGWLEERRAARSVGPERKRRSATGLLIGVLPDCNAENQGSGKAKG
jgi:hypothetical protein